MPHGNSKIAYRLPPRQVEVRTVLYQMLPVDTGRAPPRRSQAAARTPRFSPTLQQPQIWVTDWRLKFHLFAADAGSTDGSQVDAATARPHGNDAFRTWTKHVPDLARRPSLALRPPPSTVLARCAEIRPVPRRRQAATDGTAAALTAAGIHVNSSPPLWPMSRPPGLARSRRHVTRDRAGRWNRRGKVATCRRDCRRR